MKKILFILIVFSLLIGCKEHKITKKCCDSRPIQEIFNGGYLGMPNIFSPDGDGTNDRLIIQHEGLSTFNLTIRNGGGIKLFETTNPDEFWDGVHNGKTDFGSFNYNLEAKTINGEKINKKGRICVWGFSECKSCDCIEDADKCVFGDRFEKGVVAIPASKEKINISCK